MWFHQFHESNFTNSISDSLYLVEIILYDGERKKKIEKISNVFRWLNAFLFLTRNFQMRLLCMHCCTNTCSNRIEMWFFTHSSDSQIKERTLFSSLSSKCCRFIGTYGFCQRMKNCNIKGKHSLLCMSRVGSNEELFEFIIDEKMYAWMKKKIQCHSTWSVKLTNEWMHKEISTVCGNVAWSTLII